MSEAVAPIGARGRIPVIHDARVPSCAACGHGHRIVIVNADKPAQTVRYEAACGEPECFCTASGDDYDGSLPATIHLGSLLGLGANDSNAGRRARDGRHVGADGRLGVHQVTRVGWPVQRSIGTLGGIWDRVHDVGPNVAEPWLLRGAMASAGGGPGRSRARALSPVRLVAMVKSLRVWFVKL